MTKPNFNEMPLAALKAYILEHRNDDEAFQAYISRKRIAIPQLKKQKLNYKDGLDKLAS